MSRELKAATAAITGGADGLGLALGRALAKRGVRVALLDVRGDAAQQAAQDLFDDAIGLQCDVTDDASLETARGHLSDEFGDLNILWVNAGVGVAGNLADVPQRDLDWVYAVNVTGAISTVRTFQPLVEKADGLRHLGFTASSNTLGRLSGDPLGVYAASKWALLGIAESVAGAAKQEGIGTTIFSPGLLNTRIWDGQRARQDRFGGPVEMPEEVGQMWRDEGMSADWAANEAIKAVIADRAYVSPVDQHSVDDFEARVSAIREGFVVHQNQTRGNA